MLTANLLPLEEKKLIRIGEYQLMARFFGTGIAVVLMIGLVLLIPSYILLSAEKINLEEEDAAQAALAKKLKFDEVLSSALQMQALLAEIRIFFDHPSHASNLVATFFADAPGIRVGALSIASGGDVELSGFAQTRDNLVNFQKQLQDSQMLDAITFPISDIIRSADLHFTMNGKLKTGHGLY